MSGNKSDNPKVPRVTPELLEEARMHCSGWVYAIDPAYDRHGDVPFSGILGAWKVDAFGNLGEYWMNPEYEPR